MATDATLSRRPIALTNPQSGAGSGVEPAFIEWCAHHNIEVRELGDDFEKSLRAAAADAPPFVAVDGGDGTQQLAATVLSEAGVMHLPLPGGTFNHFAKSVGIDSLDAASEAIERGTVLDLPLPSIADHVILNTAVVGWYPDMVRTRERFRQRVPRPLAAAGALAIHLPKMRKFRVELDGAATSTSQVVWLAWIGNGRFGMRVDDLTARQALDEAVLDVRLLRADRKLPRLRLFVDLVFGRLRSSAGLDRTVVTSPVSISFKRPRAVWALDAEVVELPSPGTVTPATRRHRVLTA